MQNLSLSSSALQRFVETIAALRHPKTGCPWDLEQTHKTLRPYLLEEAHEAIEAIAAQDDASLCDELGDVLLQVVLHAQIARERGAFSLTDVIDSVNAKMIRRHPHVFGSATADSAAEVLQNWEALKREEKKNTTKEESSASPSPLTDRLRAIPSSLPSLNRAQRIGEKAASAGFDWERRSDVCAKVSEELEELAVEINRNPVVENDAQRATLEHELGDLLFSLCQVARWLGISAEESLRTTCERFIKRFQVVEGRSDGSLSEQSTEALEALWQQAKRDLGGNS